ncbi:Inactive hydroxysteroid dehydrogenase-like protein 1 [Melipona quadrifasciata]|uniref:Inactive hydroxysteroid dehydrogenase-like protein 1 n=1 Tax=Melipona quadrifasciata TaxID=166423 RepID=A0A0M9A633_9HYME|nr:Inactive hydroxysteroid dehydrogenase-like protein 1 [Melipona quadrifasciata]
MLQIIYWLFIILLSSLLVLNVITRIGSCLWQIIVLIIHSKSIDLRATFGNWAVVTGSTDGIGKAYAKELASRGINLVLISRNLEKLEKTKSEITQENPTIEVKIIVADFSKGKEIFEKLAEQLKDIPIGILVNNVGLMYNYPMYVGEVPEDVLWDIINVNIGATTFSEALRAEYSKFGLTIQYLTPYFVNTNMNVYSDRLQVSSIFVPNPTTYAKDAINTLGKVNSSTGYWIHEIQKIIILLIPVQIRTRVGMFINENLRNDYFKQKRSN